MVDLPVQDWPAQIWGEGRRRHGGQVIFRLCENPQEPGMEQADDTQFLGCSKACF